ncbi:MAG TPA: beta-ketoacyl-ACP synthase II [Polyangiaceae bacterium]|nr:beta-ketoacyl-ACP synthase II [Polyangiaceae bacterium]
MRRRVAITGIGLVTPLGLDRETSWRGLVEGKSGIRSFENFDASRLRTQFGGEVRGFDVSKYLSKPEERRTDRYSQLAIAAADEAMADAGYKVPESHANQVGVLLGVALGGLRSLEENHVTLLEKGPKRLPPTMVPMMLANTAPGLIAIRHGAGGPNYTLTSACASGAHAIGESAALISSGLCSAVITGGAEAVLTEFCVGGFCAMHALSTRNGEPARASRPFCSDRDGFVIAEAAAVLLLEELEAAKRRGAHIYAEVRGYGRTCDAHHITAPHPEGRGVMQALRMALATAEVPADQIGHVNAHATSTPAGDVGEARAIREILGPKVPVTAPKSMIGHTLGAAGAVEAAFTALSLKHQVIPPTLNYDTPDPECAVNVVAHEARRVPMAHALSNSFGFGGTNVSLLLSRV